MKGQKCRNYKHSIRDDTIAKYEELTKIDLSKIDRSFPTLELPLEDQLIHFIEL